MARPLRIEGAGLWYHVMCRGNARQRVFYDDRDRNALLNRLGAVAEVFRVEIHAYALMNNHVHLFARTRAANLGKFMQRVLSGYTQWFNLRHDLCGHVFQGRYKAVVVDKNAYGAEVSRYIHLNPVRTGAHRKAGVERLRALLRAYRWSSYRAMIGIAPQEPWLERTATLSRWGERTAEQEANYARYVEEGLLGEIADPIEAARAQSVLGSDRFSDRVRRILVRRQVRDKESARARRVLTAESSTTVLERVARVYGIAAADLQRTGKGQGGNEARQVAMWLARRWCGASSTLEQIGQAFGGVSRSAVAAACSRIERRAKRDKHLKRMLERVESM